MMTVLVVDAEAPIRLLISANLTPRGYQTDECDRCHAVYKKVAARRPDLIILDMAFLDNESWELLGWLAQEHIPVVVTGTLPDILKRAASYPHVRAVLLKPYAVADLLRSLAVINGEEHLFS